MQRERRKNNDILFHFRKDDLPMTKLSQLKIDPEFQRQINPPTIACGETDSKKPDKQTAGIRKSLLNGCSVQGVGCSPTRPR